MVRNSLKTTSKPTGQISGRGWKEESKQQLATHNSPRGEMSGLRTRQQINNNKMMIILIIVYVVMITDGQTQVVDSDTIFL